MRVHIVGAGPTGMTVAWEILRSTDHEVIIYDRKPSAGGSWWEPEIETRDLHAHRIVFDRAFGNTDSMFREMNIKWDDIFQPVKSDVYSIVFKNLSFRDYITLSGLATKVLAKPSKYKKTSLKKAVGTLSEKGKKLIQTLPFIMDGVDWETMSAYEFVNSFDHVGLSKQYTQRVSGKVMNDAMQKALLDKGATFMFNTHLENVDYFEDGYIATFADGVKIDDGLLVLCVDNSKALQLMGDNWCEQDVENVNYSTYGCINVLLDYNEPVELKSDLEIAMNTTPTLQPVVLSDGKTVSCVICDLTEDVLTTHPENLITSVIEQLELPEPNDARIGWGAEWKEGKWVFDQSSGVLSLKGQVPFFGECKHVALCGMMSPRVTPFSSIEAAVEVGRSFCNKQFGTRKPHHPLLVTHVIFILIAIILITIYTRKQ
jgi:hypothetical protein